jgi:SpoVK/Ycf46/Vps4 family AAA+-type ATPase
MDDNTIKNLREALEFSPNNIPLRLHLADSLLKLKRYEEAEKEYTYIIRQTPDVKARTGLAKVYFARGEYSTCNVIVEELMDEGSTELDIMLLYARALFHEGSIGKAQEVYENILSLYPDFKDAELDAGLRVSQSDNEKEFSDDEDDKRLIEKPTINFEAVGGMEDVKKEIDLKIIKPLLHADLYKAYGKKTGGGILLYGPPGCGKTHIAKATAGQIEAKFINVGINDVLEMWIGSSERNLHQVFELARQNTPCVLFFDEIDALGASRSDMKQSAGRHIINQFLQELDGINNNNDGILVMGATNAPWHLDSAFRRPGRFDRIIFVGPPDEAAREAILKLKLEGKPIDSINYGQLASKLNRFSGADINAVIDIAIEEKLEASFKTGVPEPLTTKDLIKAVKRHKPSTSEWFTTAKNFALFANESGLYDDTLKHLNIKK